MSKHEFKSNTLRKQGTKQSGKIESNHKPLCVAKLINNNLTMHVRIKPKVDNEIYNIPITKVRNTFKIEPSNIQAYYKLGINSQGTLCQQKFGSFKNSYRKNCKIFSYGYSKSFKFLMRCATIFSFSQKMIHDLIRIMDINERGNYRFFDKRLKTFIFKCFTPEELAFTAQMGRGNRGSMGRNIRF